MSGSASSFKRRIRDAACALARRRSTAEGVNRSGAGWRSFDRTRKALAGGRLSLAKKLRLGVDMVFHPESVKRAVSYHRSSTAGGNKRFAVVSFSDIHGNLGQQMQWGDFWIKQELAAAISALGGIVVEPFMRPDVMIHLFGGFYDLPPAKEHVLWIHSHPEKLTPSFLSTYDRVYCISRTQCGELEKSGLKCDWLPMATGKRLQEPGKVDERVVFVGNALPELGGHRKVVDDMLAVRAENPEIDFALWGGLYKDLPPGVLVDEYMPYHELDALYARSAIVLNDHRKEMKEQAFINPRILDVIACGGFVISDRNNVINDYFGDAVPQYESREELAELMKTYCGHPERRAERLSRARELVAAYTWRRVAKGLMGA
ncbi:MAG: glycosyltransferase family protein [Kiritimatiellia bacterium]|jgi:glycosyltransferase involved in cell wall biosynthesis